MKEFQTVACIRLLSSVVASAVNDGCSTPPRKSPGHYQITTDAFTAMRFLFDKDQSGVDAYALWLDFNVDQFRQRLLKIMSNSSPLLIAGFDEVKRRNFRFNYGMWLKMSHNGDEIKDDESDDGPITYVEDYGNLSDQFQSPASKSGGDSSDGTMGRQRRLVHRLVSSSKNTK